MDLIKSGSFSILLGSLHYKDFIQPKKNKLVKVSKINEFNNEFKHLLIIKSIKNYSKYYCVPESDFININQSSNFYKYLFNSFDQSYFDCNLVYSYIDYAGNKELLDTMDDIVTNKNFTIWKSYKFILNFTKKILKAISYLHDNKLCHLDIKPENIIINTHTKKFKLIDFGFCSLEPFDDFVNNVRGTSGYFPDIYNFFDYSIYLPKIKTNDMILVNGELPFKKNRKLVYKIDSYCLGRTLYSLKYSYKHNRVYNCRNFEKSNELKLNKIISSLTKNDINFRYSPKKCLEKFF